MTVGNAEYRSKVLLGIEMLLKCLGTAKNRATQIET